MTENNEQCCGVCGVVCCGTVLLVFLLAILAPLALLNPYLVVVVIVVLVLTLIIYSSHINKAAPSASGTSNDYIPPNRYIPTNVNQNGWRRDWGRTDGDAEQRRLFEGKRAPLISEDHHFSATALQTFDDCPMQYKFNYVSHIPTYKKTYFNLGSTVHNVIEHLTRQELDGISPTKEQARAMLDQVWSYDAFVSKKKECEDKELAEQMIDTYLAWHAQNDNQVVDVEMEFAFYLCGREVKGFIDRVEMTPEGDYVVIDFKTGYPYETRNSIKEHIQMNVYCLAILEKYGTLPRRASLFYIRHDKMVDYFPGSEQLEKQKMRFSGMIDEVLLERFPAKPAHRTCRFCDYEDLCEEKEISMDDV